MTCFAPETLIELLERGGLNAFGRDERAHLAECARCQEAWASVAAADGALRGARLAARPAASRAPWATALAAAGLMIAVIALAFWLRSRPTPTPAGAQQVDPKKVAELIAALNSDDPAARGAAEEGLVKLGPALRPQLEEGLRKAANEETRGRIRSVLQKYTEMEEEQFAIRQLEKKDRFPDRKTKSLEVSVEMGTTVAGAVEKVAQAYGLKIEFYPGDGELFREASRTALDGGFAISNGDAETALALAVSKAMEATIIVEGDRLVVVRLTPSVLVARIDLQRPDSIGEWILREYDGTLHGYWKGPMYFLAIRGDQGGEPRRRWVEILSSRALDASQSPLQRRRALRGLQAFFGRSDQPQPDITQVFLKVFRENGAPESLRAEALLGLTKCMEDEAQGCLLGVLEGREAGMSRALLGYWIPGVGVHSALQRIRSAAPSLARLEAALRSLEGAGDPDLAVRALALGAMLGREEAAVRLSRVPEPADRETLYLALDGLRVSADRRSAPVLDRIDALAGHADPQVRAVVAGVYGRSAGGTERERDVKGALALLGDRDPLVRWAAAYALGTIYSSSAAERYFEGWPGCRDRLIAALKTETHPKVRSRLEASLRDGPKE